MISKSSKLLTFFVLVIAVLFVFSACGRSTEDQVNHYTLSIDSEGEGEVDPPEGENRIEEDSVVDLTVEPAEGDWEFYDWAGKNAEEIEEENGEFKILMDEDKEITAFFADEYFEVDLSVRSFMDASGKAYDRTDNSPYPEGFKIEIEAVPETEEDSFTHWSAVYLDNLSAQGVTVQENSKNPSELFEDLESPKTKFEIPGRRVEIRPHFTTTNPPVDPGDFHYDHTDFGTEPSGGVGDTYHYWDISALEEGDKINFHFYAINIPDRFRVFYGDIDNWEDNSLKLIFDSGFVSRNPSSYEDFELYPDGVEYHDWHEQVEEETILTSYNSGVYESIIEKEANRDVVMINVQGRDDGTVWHYTVVEGN